MCSLATSQVWAKFSVYSRAVGGTSPPKISGLPKVVFTAILYQFDWPCFFTNVLRFNLRATNVQKILPWSQFSTHYWGDNHFFVCLLFDWSWAGQINLVDFSLITPYIPDSPALKEKSWNKHWQSWSLDSHFRPYAFCRFHKFSL